MKIFGTPRSDVTYKRRPGAYGIALRDGKILIELAPLGYFLPGGGIDKGETPEISLVREFLEETGYEITASRSIGTALEYIDHDEKNFHMEKVGHFFFVELGAQGKPTYADGHVKPVEWLPLEAVFDRMYLRSQNWAIREALAAQGKST